MSALKNSRMSRKIQVFLKEHPKLRARIRKSYVLLYWWWKARANLRARVQMSGLVDPHKTIWVNPKDITLGMKWDKGGYSKYGDRGKVLGGDWDRQVVPLSEIDVFAAFEEHFTKGVPWEDTDYYKRLLWNIQKKTYKRKMRNMDDLKERMDYLDELYEQIKREGYRRVTQAEHGLDPKARDEDEISVRIGRDGDLLFEDGRHRLAIAQILGVEKIPVKVTVRHGYWMKLVRDIHAYAEEHGGKVPHPIPHPDLADIPFKEGYDSLEAIKKHFPPPPSKLLEIGCGWGLVCTHLENMGYYCVGLESDPDNTRFLHRLRRAHHSRFAVVDGPLDAFLTQSSFELALAPDGFERFLEHRESSAQLGLLLERLDMGGLIVRGKEAADFAVEHSRLTESDCIARGPHHQRMFLVK